MQPRQIVLPRHSGGTDYGANRRLIAALYRPGVDRREPVGTTMLFVNEGHSAPVGGRGFGREYLPTALVLVHNCLWGGSYVSDYLERGRITKATIAKHAATINKAFSTNIAGYLDPRTTTWVLENGMIEETA